MDNPIEEFKRLHIFYSGFDYQTKELADFLDVNTRTIQRWMKGKNVPPKDKAEKIVTFLNAKKTGPNKEYNS